MSVSLYDPDEDAVPSNLDYLKLLVRITWTYSGTEYHTDLTQSQRDLSSTIPINFVTVPGVSLTAACFPRNRYDSASATKCVSNLLAAGFRRLEVDLFWDVSRTSWSFCPVQLGEIEPNLSVTQEPTTSQTPSISASLATNDLGDRNSASTTSSPGDGESSSLGNIKPRQTTGSSSLSQSSRSSMSASTLPSATTTETATLSSNDSTTAVVSGTDPESTDAPNDGTLLQVGNYICSTQLDFHQFLNVLYGHFIVTEDNLNATMKYIILNIHAAASVLAPPGSVTTPSQDSLPQGNNLLSSLIVANNSQYLYTPQLLADQRADLNKPSSWFTVRQSISPDSTFYHVDRNNSIASTPDGWPSESVVEFARARRMLAGFGRIDPEMQGYDLSLDASTIFPSGYLQDSTNITLANNGTVTSGCFFNPNNASVEAANSSWATTNDLVQSSAQGTTLDISLAQASNLTACGISPILNTTLSNSSADINPLPYKSYVMSTIWSWAANEPVDSDSSSNANDPDTVSTRCAVLNATSSHWQSHDCNTEHHSACRVENSSPYDFRISYSSAAYSKAEAACRNGISFAASRSALENSFLTSAWRSYRDEHSIDDELLWVDFNDLDIAGCWVIGQNSTCPYQDQQVGEGRRVVVPTVAAVIVFVLAILTIFIKCASNRRGAKRRRKRVDDGWDYEGVPS
jgi:hypothetical protein